MEDFKLILYVLAAVAYFVFMQWRKAFNAPKEEDEEPRGQGRGAQAPARPATSFEDILRELQPKSERAEAKGKAVAERTRELPGPVGVPFPPVAEATPVVKNYEVQTPGIKVLSLEKPSEARLAARLLEEQRIKNHVTSNERKQTAVNKYTTLLNTPASARDAFVLTEIFNRKYS